MINKKVMNLKNIAIALCFISILTLFVIGVEAANGFVESENYTTNNADAEGFVTVWPTTGKFNCRITSQTSPLETINVIGWSVATMQFLDSNGNVLHNAYAHTIQAPSGSKTTETRSVTGGPPGTATRRCTTRHDFNDNGTFHWKPYNVGTY